jgi:hypothetical protein
MSRGSRCHGPSYLGFEWGDSLFQANLSKRFRRPHLNRKKKKLGMVFHACHPSICGKQKNTRGLWSRLPWAKARPYLQNNQSKRAGGMTQRVEPLVSQVQNPEFKLW